MRIVNGHPRTGPYPQPSGEPCPNLSPNAWEPPAEGDRPPAPPRAPSPQLASTPRRVADGQAKCCNQVALASQPQLPTYRTPRVIHTGLCPGPT